MSEMTKDQSAQQNRILTLLRSKPWVTLPEILDLRIASYTRRLSDLRKLGYEIQCETSYHAGIRHSRYRLIR